MNKNFNFMIFPKAGFSQYVYPNIRKLGKSVAQCSKEAALYTDCCTMKNLNISQYECQKEFDSLKNCVNKKMKNIK